MVGGLATDTSTDWYQNLDRPAWQPPGAVFGPVWTVLYVLIAIAATLSFRDVGGPRRRLVLGLFAANLALNVAWTWIFFQGHAPTAAGVEILFLLGHDRRADLARPTTQPRGRAAPRSLRRVGRVRDRADLDDRGEQLDVAVVDVEPHGVSPAARTPATRARRVPSEELVEVEIERPLVSLSDRAQVVGRREVKRAAERGHMVVLASSSVNVNWRVMSSSKNAP